MTRARELAKLSNQNTLKIDTTQTRVGIGSTLPTASLDVGQNIYADASSGVLTATSFKGSGADLTGVSGFGTALSNTSGDLLNLVYKTPRNFVMSGVTSVYVNSDATSGNVAFTRLGGITVGGASTLHIGAGCTFVMDVLKIF
tara:strand:- start:308 stop:736 length:429 start_codon:yes stop_codon:yes gene_type:complete